MASVTDFSRTDSMGRAHAGSLYFLRQIAGVKGFLLNVYFVGDPISPTPLTREDWDAAIRSVNRELGIVREVPYSGSVFLTAE